MPGGNALPGCVEALFHAVDYTKNSVPLAEQIIASQIQMGGRVSPRAAADEDIRSPAIAICDL